MKLVHLSELHLGHEAFGWVEGGRNVREADIAESFHAALDRAMTHEPDLILLSGDIFDRVGVPHTGMRALLEGLDRAGTTLPGVQIFIVGGVRDTPLMPNESGPLSLLPLPLGVHVAVDTMRVIADEESGLRIVLLPWSARPTEDGVPDPDPDFRWNVLLAYAGDSALRSRLAGLEGWDYIGLGGGHSYRRIGPRTALPGALERIGETPWAEAAEEKGFITADLEAGTVDFVPVAGRPVVELAPLRNRNRKPDWLERRVGEVLREVPDGIDGKIVRLQTEGFPIEAVTSLPPGLIANARRRALHISVEVSPPRRTVPLGEAPDLGPVDLLGDGISADLLERYRGHLSEASGEVEPVRIQGPPLSLFRGVEFDVPRGFTVVMGGGARARSELRTLLYEAISPAMSEALLMTPRRDALHARFTGAVKELVRRSGGDALEAAIAEMSERLKGGDVPADDTTVTHTFRELERHLESLRADAAELAGEVEVATMEWLRERQDAETRLQSYRDRARELRSRIKELEATEDELPCPTCGRALGKRFTEVLETLKDEWDDIVQDGQWWRRRRSQLEVKPEGLRTLESRSVKMSADVEELAERLEVSKALGSEEEAQPSPAGTVRGASGLELRAVATELLRLLRERVRERLASFWSEEYRHLSGGKVNHLMVTESEVVLLDESMPSEAASEDESTASVALQVALLRARLECPGDPPTAAVVSPAFDSMESIQKIRALHRYRALLPALPRVISVTDGAWTDRVPESLDNAFQIRTEREGQPVAIDRLRARAE